MAWVESHTHRFAVRHSEDCTESVARWLGGLEELRERLVPHFPDPAGELTFVLHDRPALLAAACPPIAALWRASDHRSRPLINGWVQEHEVHTLSPAALGARAPADTRLAATLDHTIDTLYVRWLLLGANQDLARRRRGARLVLALRWAWLLEGASRWFSGESNAARPAVAARLRAGDQPAFPPTVNEAPLMAGTVFELLVREAGVEAAVALASRLEPGGARAALTRAFGGRSLVHTEGAWRSYLSRLATSQLG